MNPSKAIAEVVAVVLCRCERTAVVSKPKMKKLLKQFGSFAKEYVDDDDDVSRAAIVVFYYYGFYLNIVVNK